MLSRRSLYLWAATVVLGWPLTLPAQRAVRLPSDVVDTAVAGVQIDPATRVDPARMPRALQRTRLFETLGLDADAVDSNAAVVYSAMHLEDGAGRLTVYYTSLVKQRRRTVRVLPAGGPDFDARRYTLFEVRVTPLR